MTPTELMYPTSIHESLRSRELKKYFSERKTIYSLREQRCFEAGFNSGFKIVAGTEKSSVQPDPDAGVPDHAEIKVDGIGNDHGGLSLKRKQGVDYWSIENWSGHHWVKCDPTVASAIRAVFLMKKEDQS